MYTDVYKSIFGSQKLVNQLPRPVHHLSTDEVDSRLNDMQGMGLNELGLMSHAAKKMEIGMNMSRRHMTFKI